MQNSFSDFISEQGYVKIGRCFSTGNFIFLPEASGCFSVENMPDFSNASPCEYLHFNPFFIFNELLSDEGIQSMLFKLPECYGYFSKEQSPDLSFLAELIFTEYHNKEAHYEDSVRGLLLAFFSVITRNIPKENKAGRTDTRIQSALLFIHNNYTDKLSVAHIAKHCCNMSEAHFRRRFNEVMHTSPLDYINSLRIHKACQLIYHSEMHINEIAQAVGFTTLSSFNRQFQAIFCTSPTEWRKKNTGPMSQIRYTATDIFQQNQGDLLCKTYYPHQ